MRYQGFTEVCVCVGGGGGGGGGFYEVFNREHLPHYLSVSLG